MLPLLPLLVQLAGEFGPTLTGMLLGPKAGDVTKTVLATAGKVFGTTDAASIEQAVKDNPALAQVYIEQIKADTEKFKDALADIQSARAQTVQLAQAGSPIAWGAPTVSIIVVLGFITLLAIWLVHPPSNDPALLAVLNIMVGTLATAFGAVVQYWLGSSAGSATKDKAISSALALSMTAPHK